MRKPHLTDLQAVVFDLVLEGARRGRPHSHQEITEAMGYASGFSVRQHLEVLRARGLVTMRMGSRGVMPAHPAKEYGVVMNGDGMVEIYRAAPNFLDLAEKSLTR